MIEELLGKGVALRARKRGPGLRGTARRGFATRISQEKGRAVSPGGTLK